MQWNDDARQHVEEQLTSREWALLMWPLLTDEQKQAAFGFLFNEEE